LIDSPAVAGSGTTHGATDTRPGTAGWPIMNPVRAFDVRGLTAKCVWASAGKLKMAPVASGITIVSIDGWRSTFE
jgi:hypothetical protein